MCVMVGGERGCLMVVVAVCVCDSLVCDGGGGGRGCGMLVA